MSEPKFTKGPWKAHGTQDVDWVETEWKGHNGPANETRETTEYICKCGKSNGFHNSFLIAAAPEMYVMLEQLVEAVKALNAISLIKINDKLIEDAANIIKKARGEE